MIKFDGDAASGQPRPAGATGLRGRPDDDSHAGRPAAGRGRGRRSRGGSRGTGTRLGRAVTVTVTVPTRARAILIHDRNKSY